MRVDDIAARCLRSPWDIRSVIDVFREIDNRSVPEFGFVNSDFGNVTGMEVASMPPVTLHEAFAASAAQAPNCPLNFPGSKEQLTLHELHIRATAAAHGLVA